MISLISVDEIEEGSSKGIEHQNSYLFAVKKNDQVYLYRNQCPHIGTPLDWLIEQKSFWPEQISDFVRVIS